MATLRVLSPSTKQAGSSVDMGRAAGVGPTLRSKPMLPAAIADGILLRRNHADDRRCLRHSPAASVRDYCSGVLNVV